MVKGMKTVMLSKPPAPKNRAYRGPRVAKAALARASARLAREKVAARLQTPRFWHCGISEGERLAKKIAADREAAWGKMTAAIDESNARQLHAAHPPTATAAATAAATKIPADASNSNRAIQTSDTSIARIRELFGEFLPLPERATDRLPGFAFAQPFDAERFAPRFTLCTMWEYIAALLVSRGFVPEIVPTSNAQSQLKIAQRKAHANRLPWDKAAKVELALRDANLRPRFVKCWDYSEASEAGNDMSHGAMRADLARLLHREARMWHMLLSDCQAWLAQGEPRLVECAERLCLKMAEKVEKLDL